MPILASALSTALATTAKCGIENLFSQSRDLVCFRRT